MVRSHGGIPLVIYRTTSTYSISIFFQLILNATGYHKMKLRWR